MLKCVHYSQIGRTLRSEEMLHRKEGKQRMLIGDAESRVKVLCLKVLPFTVSRVEKWSKIGWRWFQKEKGVQRCFQDRGARCARGKKLCQYSLSPLGKTARKWYSQKGIKFSFIWEGMILEKEEDEDYDIRQITVRESESFLCRLGPSANKIKNEVWYREQK